MSRSYRHHHVVTVRDNANLQGYANHVVRHVPIELTDTLQGGGYKRHYESWNIRDHGLNGDSYSPEERQTRRWMTTYLYK